MILDEPITYVTAQPIYESYDVMYGPLNRL